MDTRVYTVDTEDINAYIDRHPDEGCRYYHSCLECPFPECWESKTVLHIRRQIENILAEK